MAHGETNKVCCSECLRESEYYAAKEAGQPLPFKGYENTLDWRHLTIIENLEERLRKHCKFEKSRYPFGGGTDSLVIIPGDFTQPLTISMYYVTDIGEQNYLLEIIDDFFAKVEHSQRKVEFFEAECWHQEIRGKGSSLCFLQAKLLREVVV